MISRAYSAAVFGLEAKLVEIELDLLPGLPVFQIVGLPDKAVHEARERICSAIKNSGARSPLASRRKIVVNLAPADLKKQGSSYDLPMAAAYLAASSQIPENALRDKMFSGELSLDGRVRHISGILSVALMAQKKGFEFLFVPKANAKEAALVKELKIIPVSSLKELIAHLTDNGLIAVQPPTNFEEYYSQADDGEFDFSYIKGQDQARRALEVAAAGGHNVLMHGPPGAGKTLLARSFPSILPPLFESEALEVTKIFSVAGKLSSSQPLIAKRPFRFPHHTASVVSLIGGGASIRPGEISLAHRGVLFLDEFPEFGRSLLESLRQPLEDGVVNISRASGSFMFPAKFILLAAMNPCPCGHFGDVGRACVCSAGQITKYKNRISGPLLDRIDLHLEVPALSQSELLSLKTSENSSIIKQRVVKAREIQKQRFAQDKIMTNSEMRPKQIREYCLIDSAGQALLEQASRSLNLSARSYDRILRLARTIADLAGEADIGVNHLAEAIQYRPRQER